MRERTLSQHWAPCGRTDCSPLATSRRRCILCGTLKILPPLPGIFPPSLHLSFSPTSVGPSTFSSPPPLPRLELRAMRGRTKATARDRLLLGRLCEILVLLPHVAMITKGETLDLPRPRDLQDFPGLGNAAPVLRWPRHCEPWDRPETLPGAEGVLYCPMVNDPNLRWARQPDTFPDPERGGVLRALQMLACCRPPCLRGAFGQPPPLPPYPPSHLQRWRI